MTLDEGKVAIRQATTGDALAIAPRLSSRSRMEIRCVAGPDASHADVVIDAIDKCPERSFAVEIDGTLVALMGGYPMLQPSVWSCWFVFADDFFVYGFAPSAVVRVKLQQEMAAVGARKLVSYSWNADRLIALWFRRMGFLPAKDHLPISGLTVFEAHMAD